MMYSSIHITEHNLPDGPEITKKRDKHRTRMLLGGDLAWW